MEEQIQIPTDDGHIVYGVLNYKEKSDKLIILCHGLAGSSNEHMHFNASRFFTKEGYATFRFNFYDGKEKSRTLEDTSVSEHIQDLNKVIENFSDFKEIYLVGHSMAGPTILLSSLSLIKKIVLWDPSVELKLIQPRYTYNEKLNLYCKKTRFLKCIGKKMYNEWATIDFFGAIENVRIPTKLIFAGDGVWYGKKDKIDALGNTYVSTSTIPGASHCFDEEGTEEELFAQTLDFLS